MVLEGEGSGRYKVGNSDLDVFETAYSASCWLFKLVPKANTRAELFASRSWHSITPADLCNLAERLHKYSEVQALDARSNSEKDAMLRSQQDEISRLRTQLAGPAR